MPEHCIPRNFEWEREQTWGGGPVMNETDRPVSFVVRGPMLRNSPSVPNGDIEPRGLPPPRFKTPPPPLRYRPKQREAVVDPATIDPSEIEEWDGVKYWMKNGVPHMMPGSVRPEPRIAVPKAPLAQPIPGLSKSSRGRHVPKRGANEAADRKHCCPVPGCVKMFTKRDHLNRHIKSLHQHDKEFFCPIPNCDKSFTRADNYNRHWRKHQSHTQEIFACSPEDDYKGVHLENPIFTQGGDFLDIKPFANIAIHPLAFDLWHWRETERREGRDPPGKTACDRYFDAHPEERESAFRRDPKWEWRLPPPGPEFTPVDHRGSLQGEFKLNIKSQST